jgi:molecular chaperone GrpE
MAERDDNPPEETQAYELDLEAAEDVDVDALAREALAAVTAAAEEREAPAGDAPAAAGDSAGGGDADVAQLQAELADLRDRSIRTLADFENYRKRSDREREDLKRYATTDVLRDFLPVVDNLERALAAGGTVDDLKMGVDLTLRHFRDLLRQRGVVEVKAAGEAFDPAVHEAVARDEDPAVSAPTVTAELQRGYMLNGRLLRPALVRVAVPGDGSGG